MDVNKKNNILGNAYTDSQEMIRFADSKANISLTIHSILITLTLGFSLLSNIFDKLLTLVEQENYLANLYIWSMILFISFSIAGIITTILVFKPRKAKEKGEEIREGFFYYGHVAAYNSSDDYYSRIKDLTEEQLLEEYARQIYQISCIAKSKFKYVKASILFLIINMFLTVFFLILSSMLNLKI